VGAGTPEPGMCSGVRAGGCDAKLAKNNFMNTATPLPVVLHCKCQHLLLLLIPNHV
jgi:hypothetical protein